MLMLLLSALALQPAAGDGRLQLNGRCQYNEAVARHRDDTVLALCDSLRIAHQGARATIDFRQRSWGSTMAFSGTMAGDRMTVSRIDLRGGKSAAATGTCEIFHAQDRVSAVACLVRAEGKAYAANFVPSRIEPAN